MKEFGQPAVVLKETARPTIEHMLAIIEIAIRGTCPADATLLQQHDESLAL